MTLRAHFQPKALRRERDTLADGSSWAYSYNDRSEVTGGVKHLPPAQAEATARGHAFGYGYDPIGNRKQSTVNGRTAAYTANALNQYAQRAVPPAVDVLGSAAPEAVVHITGPQGTQTAWRQGAQFSLTLSVDNAAAAQFPEVGISAKRSTVAGGGAVTETTSPPSPLTGKLFLAKNPEVYAYDFDGNTLSDGRWDYTWDGENRLKSAETRAGAVAAGAPRVRVEYGYDGRGRRIARTVRSGWNGTAYAQAETRRFLYNAGWNVLAEIDGTGAVVRRCLWGLDLSGSREGAGGIGGLLVESLAATPGGALTDCLPFYDGNGNITGLVKATDGMEAARYSFGPFGEELRQSGEFAAANPFRWSTKYRDDLTGWEDYGYRWLGDNRWLSRDPISELGFHLLRTGQHVFLKISSDSPPTPTSARRIAIGLIQHEGFGSLEEVNVFLQGPEGTNLHCLTGNNPVNFVDYLGLAPFCICVRAGDDHAWIHVKDLATGEAHTYGRWKIGYGMPAASSSGVIKDMELKRIFAASRCVTVQTFAPTINAGYTAYSNNCATYARDEWKRITGENLDIDEVGPFGWDSPSTLKDSINKKNGGKKKSEDCCGDAAKK